MQAVGAAMTSAEAEDWLWNVCKNLNEKWIFENLKIEISFSFR